MKRMGRPVGSTKFPFGEMKVGDSFFYDVKWSHGLHRAKLIFMKAHPGTNFTTRKRLEDGKSGFRVWRVQ